jgi:hypothetical protein
MADALASDALLLVVFHGPTRIATGGEEAAKAAVRRALEAEPFAPVQVFNARTGGAVDLDLRSPAAPAQPVSPRRGRPKLGVLAREVTLLPRHWEWLSEQPGGASAALRRLVEAARKANTEAEHARRSREAAFRFLSAIAGDLPGFEEASRALFAGDEASLVRLMGPWPGDIGKQAIELFRGESPS